MVALDFEIIRKVLVARETNRLLQEEVATLRDSGAEIATFQDMLMFVRSSDPVVPARFARALAQDRMMYEDFRALLSDMAVGFVPAAAAASSGELDQRTAGPFSIEIIPSRQGSGQVYLVIKMPFDTAHVSTMTVLTEDRVERTALSTPVDGVVQMILEQDDPLVAILRNPRSEIAFR